MKRTAAIVALLATIAWLPGCIRRSASEVVVYTAQDTQYAEPIFADFQRETGIRVRPHYDTESTKTTGLAASIFAEKSRPRCNVFWNNEILHSIRLAEAGLVDVYQPKLAAEFPASSRGADGAWHGFAARARVLLVNTRVVPQADRPRSIRALAEPRWRDRCGLAKPLFGTTATHAACLFAVWGDERAKEFFDSVARTARVMAGNSHVAQAVGSGQLAFGLTDTDDAVAEIERGSPVTIVYPDQEEGGLGTLVIPNTLVVVKGCPHPAAARRLVDYLLSPSIESKLAAGPSAQMPLHPNAKASDRVAALSSLRTMEVDFREAARKWDSAKLYLRERFATAGR